MGWWISRCETHLLRSFGYTILSAASGLGVFESGGDVFELPDILEGLAFADEVGLASVDEDFGGEGAAVVVAGHDGAVGPGAEHGEELAGFGGGDTAFAGEGIAGFTDGADYIGLDGGALGFSDGDYFVVAFVEGWADEVIHGGVDDDEVAFAGFFEVFDAGDEDAGVTGDEASGFEEDFEAERLEQGDEGFGVGLGCEDIFCGFGAPPGRLAAGEGGLIDDAEAAADGEEFDAVFLGEFLGEGSDFSDGFGEGFDFGELGADVHLEAAEVDILEAGGALVDGLDFFEGDAEFIFVGAGGDFGVGFGVDVRVDADSDGGFFAEFGCDLIDAFQFGFTFDIEGIDALADGVGDFAF